MSRLENTLTTPVHVLGDATYAVQGDVCGVHGTGCPRTGDVAIADCTPFLPSYVPSVGCIMSSNTTCSIIASVMDSSSVSYYACVFPVGGEAPRVVDKFASRPIDKTAAPTPPTATHATMILVISVACACCLALAIVVVLIMKAKAQRTSRQQAAQARAIVDQALVPSSDDESGGEVILV
ncbi:hypothetical protein SPRG_05652 [Saprolegnia parasitica CBS 223.65]|uniref:Uncharacterized protein n=1 Tax=Saprolegnia parasitica (strain CBS 223.65) TaxID=695850 RepID=A0A067CT64_SAPPC|nr:hypothetical protein SPRG_05652 [Saprolegnia parasitica CBS 223.65]KDO29701.1 hypothetical protein SPRG_05652 [Saprolegnia parasitica CBS 223.65]|eukprot:XP_012199758.1 hypothetical protein SPRG_05652 [Saprolegnia parasitica CBS 223.65]